MIDTRYVGLIPAENPARQGASVNLMVMADNRGEARVAPVRFYGRTAGPWREFYMEPRELDAETHIHLYFNLPASCFAPEKWDGEEPEELALWAGETEPGPEEQGILLFLEP